MRNSSRLSRLPRFARAAMALQVFLLRRNWIGPLGEEIMVITTTGRRTGRVYSTPIGYLRDGSSVIALTSANASDWYKNALKSRQARLEIKGKTYLAQATPIDNPEERRRIFERYRQERARHFQRLFGVPADASPEELEKALESRRFIRFYLS